MYVEDDHSIIEWNYTKRCYRDCQVLYLPFHLCCVQAKLLSYWTLDCGTRKTTMLSTE